MDKAEVGEFQRLGKELQSELEESESYSFDSEEESEEPLPKRRR